jgi:hypothetical protein
VSHKEEEKHEDLSIDFSCDIEEGSPNSDDRNIIQTPKHSTINQASELMSNQKVPSVVFVENVKYVFLGREKALMMDKETQTENVSIIHSPNRRVNLIDPREELMQSSNERSPKHS